MTKFIGGAILMLCLVAASYAADPTKHPCTHETIPLTTEKSVVQAVECLYQGRVAKVTQVKTDQGDWYYQLRILISGGRIKTVDINPETGLPLDPVELESLYEIINR
ncbi:MAG: hypothetical protein P8X74_01755 [Reinekea sp.]|jgi:hypothetical protein